MTFGEQIKKIRKECKLTQEQLAAELGVSKGSISLFETDSRTPSLETAKKMYQIFYNHTGRRFSDELFGYMKNPDSIDEDCRSVYRSYSDWAGKYGRLDIYGKATVEAVIRAEFERCKNQGILTPSAMHNIESFEVAGDRYIHTDISDSLGEYVMKYVRLDEYGRAAVEEIIRILYSRCLSQNTLIDSAAYKISANANINDNTAFENKELL